MQMLWSPVDLFLLISISDRDVWFEIILLWRIHIPVSLVRIRRFDFVVIAHDLGRVCLILHLFKFRLYHSSAIRKCRFVKARGVCQRWMTCWTQLHIHRRPSNNALMSVIAQTFLERFAIFRKRIVLIVRSKSFNGHLPSLRSFLFPFQTVISLDILF